MQTFASRKKPAERTTAATPARKGPGQDGSPRWSRSTDHLQRVIGNHATQRMLAGRTERAARPVASDAHSGLQPIVRQQRHTFSAAIRRVASAPQHDLMDNADASPANVSAESKERKSVLFPSDSLRAAVLPGQSDAIASTFEYQGSIGEGRPPARPDKFGETTPVFEFAKPGPRAEQQQAGTFTVTGTIVGNVTFWVDGGGKKDIASDTDPDITPANYPTVVRDLTPSPTEVNRAGVFLYKNQPPRTAFWARDLTVKHETFHADEDVKFGEDGVKAAQAWLNRQTAQTFDQVGALLNQVNPRVARTVDTAMALPGRENRAYAAGATDYSNRAQAIKTKGDAKGYVPPPPAPRTPVVPPARTPQTPGPPPTPPRSTPDSK
jgi:hypothetical protein